MSDETDTEKYARQVLDAVLPPFSGDDPACAKCANVGASTDYIPVGRCVERGVILGMWSNERLCRACLRCGYHWDEATV
ncbi:MAG: hypothetical protein JWM93_2476 [Frankiales bacterium]|nr:hypothetical protein [Frankiales bacterium]